MVNECFIDIHCHLDHCKGQSIENIVKNARKEGVGIIVSAGVNRETNRLTLNMAKKYKEIKACLGIYPIDALAMSDEDIESELKFIEKNEESIIAIGEVGIDFKEDTKNHERQKKIFEKFVELSMKLNKPIIVHSRGAELECIEILENLNAERVIMHCFCGKKSLVERVLKNKWFLTIPTNVNNSQQFQERAKDAPLNQIFCETDSPFLHPNKERNNEPKNIIVSYEWIAKMKKIDIEEVKREIFDNFKREFIQ
ncbi:MAG: TatD family hydrolase [Nanoarchaeota archaeon]